MIFHDTSNRHPIMENVMQQAQQKKKWVLGLGLAASLASVNAATVDPTTPGIVGKNDWLFYRHELTEASDAPYTATSIDLISRLNKEFSRNGVTLAFTMVPIKMRVYAEHLPPEVKTNDFMMNNYDRMAKLLQAAAINFVDLNKPFMTSPQRVGENPFFLRSDTHWAPSGSMLAAETIKGEIDANPALKKALMAVPEQKFTMAWDKRKMVTRARDLVPQLPKGSPLPGPEQLQQFSISRVASAEADTLLGDAAGPGVTLMGSSYSHAWTRFPEALRYTLQRDVLSISVGADQGSWVGMESYLRDDAFQTQRPKLVIWEMPERDMRAPPNYKYREARYLTDNTEWLLRAAAWIQQRCESAPASVKVEATGLAAGGQATAATTVDNDFVELTFDKPVDKLDYLSARLTATGSKLINIEASGPGTPARRFTVQTSGDEAAHAFRLPLPSGAKGFTKVRILPGKTEGFSLKDVQVCRLPEDLIK